MKMEMLPKMSSRAERMASKEGLDRTGTLSVVHLKTRNASRITFLNGVVVGMIVLMIVVIIRIIHAWLQSCNECCRADDITDLVTAPKFVRAKSGQSQLAKKENAEKKSKVVELKGKGKVKQKNPASIKKQQQQKSVTGASAEEVLSKCREMNDPECNFAPGKAGYVVSGMDPQYDIPAQCHYICRAPYQYFMVSYEVPFLGLKFHCDRQRSNMDIQKDFVKYLEREDCPELEKFLKKQIAPPPLKLSRPSTLDVAAIPLETRQPSYCAAPCAHIQPVMSTPSPLSDTLPGRSANFPGISQQENLAGFYPNAFPAPAYSPASQFLPLPPHQSNVHAVPYLPIEDWLPPPPDPGLLQHLEAGQAAIAAGSALAAARAEWAGALTAATRARAAAQRAAEWEAATGPKEPWQTTAARKKEHSSNLSPAFHGDSQIPYQAQTQGSMPTTECEAAGVSTGARKGSSLKSPCVPGSGMQRGNVLSVSGSTGKPNSQEAIGRQQGRTSSEKSGRKAAEIEIKAQKAAERVAKMAAVSRTRPTNPPGTANPKHHSILSRMTSRRLPTKQSVSQVECPEPASTSELVGIGSQVRIESQEGHQVIEGAVYKVLAADPFNPGDIKVQLTTGEVGIVQFVLAYMNEAGSSLRPCLSSNVGAKSAPKKVGGLSDEDFNSAGAGMVNGQQSKGLPGSQRMQRAAVRPRPRQDQMQQLGMHPHEARIGGPQAKQNFKDNVMSIHEKDKKQLMYSSTTQNPSIIQEVLQTIEQIRRQNNSEDYADDIEELLQLVTQANLNGELVGEEHAAPELDVASGIRSNSMGSSTRYTRTSDVSLDLRTQDQSDAVLVVAVALTGFLMGGGVTHTLMNQCSIKCLSHYSRCC
eukprot:gnl/MRDRNA2_/MRDRNA2_67546_c0_seq1.p1 gnl/MRDRNA2_/MRDRNA2_67546_c0~~gnl/MRDRNA2_/MRDRNA2_67546_c0_seq1.p1  ORF type:complete len:869 (-),score=164.42 gnl/MRDRNA2_/MRDRNA2_67546_c0_seq1:121-2727(-)